jgi:hypothetical protein
MSVVRKLQANYQYTKIYVKCKRKMSTPMDERNVIEMKDGKFTQSYIKKKQAGAETEWKRDKQNS